MLLCTFFLCWTGKGILLFVEYRQLKVFKTSVAFCASTNFQRLTALAHVHSSYQDTISTAALSSMARECSPDFSNMFARVSKLLDFSKILEFIEENASRKVVRKIEFQLCTVESYLFIYFLHLLFSCKVTNLYWNNLLKLQINDVIMHSSF